MNLGMVTAINSRLSVYLLTFHDAWLRTAFAFTKWNALAFYFMSRGRKLIDNMYVKMHIPNDEPQVGGFYSLSPIFNCIEDCLILLHF